MKKLLHSVIAICFLFLGTVLYLYYSEAVYKQVFSEKYPITISAGGRDKDSFLEFLEVASDSTDTPLFYTAVINASGLKPHFHIYTTSMDEEFMGIPNDYPDKKILPQDSISTSGDALYHAFAGNTGYDFTFHAFCEADGTDFENSVFYAAENCEDFLELLETEGYTYSVGEEELIGIFDLKMAVFIIMLIFVFLLTLYYANSRNREIVIRKVHGYRAFDIFRSVFIDGIYVILISSVSCPVIVLVVCAFFYGKTVLWFAGWAFPYYAAYLLLILAAYISGCMIYSVRVASKEIITERPKKWLQAITMILRIGSILTVIWGLSYSFLSVSQYLQFSSCKQNTKKYHDLITVIVNTKGSEMTNEHNERFYEFMQLVSGKFDTYIVDAGYIEDSELYVSRSYFDLINCTDTEGIRITSDYFSDDSGITVLVPDGMAMENTEGYNVISYQYGHSFPVLDAGYYEGDGFAVNPIIYIYDEEGLKIQADSIVSCQYFYISCDINNALRELMPMIEEAGLSDIVREAVTVNDLYNESMYNAGTFVVCYIVLGVFYLAILILLTIFETIVYFENNSRELCIKFLHGFDAEACRRMWISKAITYILILVISYMMGFIMAFALFAAVLDALLFTASIDKLKSRGMLMYLKGEN